MNICELLKARAAQSPEVPAIIETRFGRSRSISFGQLEVAAAQAAALLQQEGLSQGDRVLVFLPMSAELYIALLAIFRLGMVAVFLDPSAGRRHIERCCALSPPKALIAGARTHLLRLLSPALQRIPVKFSIGLPVPGAVSWHRFRGLPPHDPIQPCGKETPALLTFTSGSTGEPKGAVRSHGFLHAQHRILAQSLALGAGEVDLTALPVFVLANLASGVTSLIPDADLRRPGFIKPARLLRQIRAHQPTRTIASPALLECLADHCAKLNVTLPGLKWVFTGGGPVFPRLLDKLRSMAPLAEIIAVYGSTEAEPIALIRHHQIPSEDRAAMAEGCGLLAGRPVPAVQVRILPDRWGRPLVPYSRAAFAAACLPPGQAGEIVVSGAHVLSEYLNGDGDHETKFTVEETVWHRTGDAGYFDNGGRLWLLGRCAAGIQDTRGTLYPFTVECVAHQHPGISRAAVVSHNSRRILAVECDPHTTDPDLASIKAALAWVPIDEIQVHKRIPMDKRHNAKIDYPALRALVMRPT
ncbi:MAG TPA: AMP-binding protein [Anaerolineales bacterium]|nr:AMP-binding protein [Anaerolineales bacterium]